MPAMAPVVLTDDHTTDHTFTPRGFDAKGVAVLKSSSGVPIGDKILTVSRSTTAAGREKALLKLTIPVVQTETENGISRPTIVRVAYCEASFSFDGASSDAERADARKMLADLIGDGQALAGSIVDDLETLY